MANNQDQSRNNQGQSGQFQQGQPGRQPQQAGGQPGQQQGGAQQGGQQQQFNPQSGQQSGSSGAFADQIRAHQKVVDARGNHVGTVDHVQGDQIKLTRSDSSDGEHHYVPLSQVSGIEGGKVCLRERGDNDFGQET